MSQKEMLLGQPEATEPKVTAVHSKEDSTPSAKFLFVSTIEQAWEKILNASSHPVHSASNQVEAIVTGVDQYKGAYVDIHGLVAARIYCNHLVPGMLQPGDKISVAVISADQANQIVRVSHTNKLQGYFSRMKLGQETAGVIVEESDSHYSVRLVDYGCRAELPKKLLPTPFDKTVGDYLEGLTVAAFNADTYHLVVSAVWHNLISAQRGGTTVLAHATRWGYYRGIEEKSGLEVFIDSQRAFLKRKYMSQYQLQNPDVLGSTIPVKIIEVNTDPKNPQILVSELDTLHMRQCEFSSTAKRGAVVAGIVEERSTEYSEFLLRLENDLLASLNFSEVTDGKVLPWDVVHVGDKLQVEIIEYDGSLCNTIHVSLKRAVLSAAPEGARVPGLVVDTSPSELAIMLNPEQPVSYLFTAPRPVDSNWKIGDEVELAREDQSSDCTTTAEPQACTAGSIA